MDWTWFHQLGQLEFWEGLLAGFEDLGPLVPILLAAVESFFPPLPLVAIAKERQVRSTKNCVLSATA